MMRGVRLVRRHERRTEERGESRRVAEKTDETLRETDDCSWDKRGFLCMKTQMMLRKKSKRRERSPGRNGPGAQVES